MKPIHFHLIIDFALIFLLSGTVPAYAQDAGFGISAGINYSDFDYQENSDATSYQSKISYQIAFSLQREISGQWFLTPAVRLMHTKSSAEIDIRTFEGPNPTRVDFSQSYLNLALMNKYFLSKKPGFYFSFGPEIGYLLASESNTKFSDGQEIKKDVSDDFKKIIFSANITLGTEFKVDKTNLFAELSYFHSLMPVTRGITYLPEWRTRLYFLNLGILL